MLFDNFADEKRAAVRTWLTGPEPVLTLECDSEMQPMAARIVASFEKDEPARVFVGFSGSFMDAAAFYTQAARSIEEDLQIDESDCERLRLRPLRIPPMPGDDAHPQIESRFAAFLEGAANAVAPLAEALVVTLHFEDADDDDALRQSATNLAAAIGSPFVKVVVLDRRDEPRLRGIEAPRQRVVHRPFVPMKTDLPALVTAARRDGTRIVVLETAAPARVALRRATKSLLERHLVLDGAFSRPGRFWERSLGALLEAQDRDPVDFALERYGGPDDPDGLAALEASVLTFVSAAADSPAPLVVLVDPDVTKPEAYRRSIAELSRIAYPLHVVFLVVDRSDAPALADLELPAAVVTHEDVHLDVAELEPAAEAKLADPNLPPLTRMQLLQLVASTAATRGDAAGAFEKSSQSIELADQHGEPEDLANAWLVMGHCLYRAEAFNPARAAFLHAAEVAIDNGVDPLVPPAMMASGHCHFRQRELAEALRCYVAALEYYRAMQDLFGEAQALTWMAEASARMGSHGEAETHFDDAIRCYDRAPACMHTAADNGKAEVLARRASLYEAAGRTTDASRMRENAAALGGETHVCPDP